MIEFKEDVKKMLPYNRQKYMEYLVNDDDFDTSWYGVSFQLPVTLGWKEVPLTKFIEVYEPFIKNIILKLDNGSFWIVNHDKSDRNWLPNNKNNLPHLRILFKKNNIPNTFKGALLFTKDDLLKFSKDLISYPSIIFEKEGLSYWELDISHNELSFIIKITGQWAVSLLSVNKEFLRKIVDENSSGTFIVREYTGTSLRS